MLTIYLLSGPRGAGKSVWGKKFATENGFKYFSRDEVANRVFGNECLDPYVGAFYYIRKVLAQKIQRLTLIANSRNRRLGIVVDYWNGSNNERGNLKKILSPNESGNEIHLMVMTTSHDLCVEQFNKREGIKHGWKPSQDWYLYHKLLDGVEDLGFDEVSYIDPAQLELL